MAELARRFSPMVYANNNPLRFIDPDGMKTVYSNGGYYDDQTNESRSWYDVQNELGIGGSSASSEPQSGGGEGDKTKVNSGKQHDILPIRKGQNFYKRQEDGTLEMEVNGVTPDYTLDGMYIGGKVLGPIFGGLAKLLGFGSKFASLTVAETYGIKSYSTLRTTIINQLGTGSGYEVHHLIEQRFASLFGQKAKDMLSVVVTKAEHDVFTKDWYSQIGRNGWNSTVTTSTATRKIVEDAAKIIYKDYPEILKALGL